MGCDRCAKRLVCLYPWRRTVEGYALTGPLRSVRTYPRPLPLQSQRAECGRRGGCSGGSVAAAPQKCPLPAPKHPREPGFLHLSLTSVTVLRPSCGGDSVPARNRLPLSRRVFPVPAAPSGPIRGGRRAAPSRWPTGYAARTDTRGSCRRDSGMGVSSPPPLGLDHQRGTGGVPPVDCRSSLPPACPRHSDLASVGVTAARAGGPGLRIPRRHPCGRFPRRFALRSCLARDLKPLCGSIARVRRHPFPPQTRPLTLQVRQIYSPRGARPLPGTAASSRYLSNLQDREMAIDAPSRGCWRMS